jgi:cell division protein FtsB
MSIDNYLNIVRRFIIGAVVLLALIGIGFAFLPKVSQFREYQQTKETLEARLRAAEEEIKELKLKQEKFATDKYYVQQIAHDIGYAHDDETIFQFNDQLSTNPLDDEAQNRQNDE